MYNREKRIEKALKSLSNQSFQDFETIVADDASIDNSFEIASNYMLANKRVIRNEKNSERCVTRNNGIAIAKGKYICFLDSDDFHFPNHLELLHEFIQSKNTPVAFFFSNAVNVDEDGVFTERDCPRFEDFDKYKYFLRYTPNPQRWAVHRDILANYLFDPNIVIAEDMDLALRIAKAGFPIYHLNQVTTAYVSAEDSFTVSDPKKSEKELKYFLRIFEKQELRAVLPTMEKRRLLSMCYFHLAVKNDVIGESKKALKYAIKSLCKYPKGYNGKTFKILVVILIYNFPLLGKKFRGKSVKN